MGKPGCFGSALIFLLLCYFVYQADLNGQIPAALDPRTVAVAKPGQSPQPVMQAQAQATPTITQTPTLSVDYQKLYDQQVQTSESSDLTLVAANVIIVGYTAQFNSDQSAEKIAEDNRLAAEAAAQIISIGQTASLQPTVAQWTKSASETQIVGTQQAPVILDAYAQALENKTEAELFAENGQEEAEADLALRWSGTAFISLLIIYLLSRIIEIIIYKIRSSRSSETQADQDEEEEKRRAEFEKDEDSDGENFVRIYPDIPCPLNELLQFSAGVLDRNLTLVFRDWNRTPVYPYLKDLRLFFKRNRMADSISGGELIMNKKGIEFLRVTRADGSPPLPYQCAL